MGVRDRTHGLRAVLTHGSTSSLLGLMMAGEWVFCLGYAHHGGHLHSVGVGTDGMPDQGDSATFNGHNKHKGLAPDGTGASLSLALRPHRDGQQAVSS